MELDPVREHFRQGVRNSLWQGRGAALDEPVADVIRRERVAFEQPGGELLHLAQAQVRRGAVCADYSGMHHEAEDHGRGLVARDEQPQLAGLTGLWIEDEPVDADIVEGDKFEEAKILARAQMMREVLCCGGCAFVQKGADSFGELCAGFDLAENIVVGPTLRNGSFYKALCGEFSSNPFLPEAVAGNGPAHVVNVEASLPPSMES